MMDAIELKINLDQFTGTSQYHPHMIGLQMTDGVKYLCDQAQSYWLMDIIASYQNDCKKDEALKYMQFWTIKTKNKKAVVICERDTNDVAFKQEIAHTDFPLDEAKIWVSNGVALLPSEY